MDELAEQLRLAFLEEASELLSNAEQAFLKLEEMKDDPAIIDQIFRLAHNLKGSARAVGFDQIGNFTHKLESFILKIKNRELNLESHTVDLLLRCNDFLCQSVELLKGGTEPAMDETLLHELIQATAGNLSAPADLVEAKTSTTPEGHLNESKEVPSSPDPLAALQQINHDIDAVYAAAVQVTSALHPSSSNSNTGLDKAKNDQNQDSPTKANKQASDESIRVSLNRLENLINNIGELVILQTVLNQQKSTIPSPFLQKTITQLAKITKDIQDISMSLRMVSLKQTFQKLQRIVRDSSKELGKNIRFELQGEDTELDKTVVDQLGDPLVHLIRNAVDHGIESSSERLEKGKSDQGHIKLSAYHQGGNVVIEIRDDGKGLNAEKLTQKAIEKGLLPKGKKLAEKEAQMLIFHAGFSTKEQVTDLSGRGVGMDVVRTNIEHILKGEIQLDSRVDQGTTFKVILPLTLAIIDGMVIRCGQEKFIVPLTQVHESVSPKASDIHNLKDAGSIFHLRQENIPLHHLGQILGIPMPTKPADGKTKPDIEENPTTTAIVVRMSEQPFAVMVDEIIGRQQVVIKKLGIEIGTIKGIIGGAILGDGNAALILDLPELIVSRKATGGYGNLRRAS